VRRLRLYEVDVVQGSSSGAPLGGEKVVCVDAETVPPPPPPTAPPHPYMSDVIAQMRSDGVTHIKAVLPCAAESRTSVGLYRRHC